MDSSAGWRPRAIGHAALAFLFGIEMVRVHVASLGWYQRDTLGIGAIDLIPIAVMPFAAGFLLPILGRVLGLRVALWAGTAVLVVTRILTQGAVDPAVIHWSSGVAVAAFVGLLALHTRLGRQVVIGGVLLGITVDAAIKAQGVTLDLTYRPGLAPLLAVLVLAAILVGLLVATPIDEPHVMRWGASLTLLGFGPFLFVQLLVLQSPGWLAAMTGLSAQWAGLVIVALDLVALWLASRWARSPTLTVIAAVVVAAAVAVAEGPPPLFGILVLAAIPLTGVLWAALVPDMGRRPGMDAGTRAGSAMAGAVGMVLGALVFLFLGFAYVLPLDLHLGFTQAQARLAGAVLLAVAGLAAAAQRSAGEPAVPARSVVLAALLLLLPLAGFLGGQTLPAPSADPPLRVMSYNVHQAFGTAGDMDVAAVADVIIGSGATLVGVQEIPRGGLMNAGTDLLTLLGQRLGWEHVAYIGTNDPVWGNAILSRHPLADIERAHLPLVGTPFRRGYVAATVDTPIGAVLFASIHLQHINDPAGHAIDPEADLYPVHTAQLGVWTDRWAGRTPAFLVGDLNARPGWRQVDELLDAGWVDAWAQGGEGDGFTADAADPRYRIDYVFHTPDLQTLHAEVIESQASDHFAVIADVVVSGG